MRDIRKQVNNMDRDNKREITISIPEPIYEELQNAAKQLSGWEHESSREQNVRYLIHGNRRMW